jgi:DNA-binding transcriptional ArsR family regulator
MRTPPPALLPLLRSQVQGELLALLYLHPDGEYSLTDAARHIGVTPRAVHAEASRLVAGGLVADRRVGNTRLLRAATGTLLTRPLTELLAVTYGPLPVLTEALRSVPGAERAYIYGSWAARYRGDVGPVPVDVDVLVIGTADLDDLEEAVRQCEPVLGREVSIRRIRPDVWDGEGVADPFLASVKSKPLVELDLGHDEAVGA